MTTEILMLMLAAVILCVIFYLAAGNVYTFHYKLKEGGSPLSKVLTGDRDKLDDRARWIRRYRAKMIILLSVIIFAPLIKHFAL